MRNQIIASYNVRDSHHFCAVASYLNILGYEPAGGLTEFVLHAGAYKRIVVRENGSIGGVNYPPTYSTLGQRDLLDIPEFKEPAAPSEIVCGRLYKIKGKEYLFRAKRHIGEGVYAMSHHKDKWVYIHRSDILLADDGEVSKYLDEA